MNKKPIIVGNEQNKDFIQQCAPLADDNRRVLARKVSKRSSTLDASQLLNWQLKLHP